MSRISKSQILWSNWHHRLHKTLIKKKALLPKNAPLLLAVSGGQDSMALVKLISDLQRVYGWKLSVWHGDHGWHKKSKQIANELKIWCAQENIIFYTNAATKEETKTESLAREWRYQNLVRTALELSLENSNSQCIHVLTGHTSSDRTETLIMNLARGSDLTGLTSLRECRILEGEIKLIRPLLCFSRKETAQICKELELPIWLDPSNENPIFNRNKIRHQILPLLEEINKGCSLRISNLAERLSYYQEDQKALAHLAINSIKHNNGLCRKKLMTLSFSARSLIIAKWLEEFEITQLSSKKIAEISHKIGPRQSPGSSQLAKNWEIVWTKEYVEISQPKKR